MKKGRSEMAASANAARRLAADERKYAEVDAAARRHLKKVLVEWVERLGLGSALVIRGASPARCMTIRAKKAKAGTRERIEVGYLEVAFTKPRRDGSRRRRLGMWLYRPTTMRGRVEASPLYKVLVMLSENFKSIESGFAAFDWAEWDAARRDVETSMERARSKAAS